MKVLIADAIKPSLVMSSEIFKDKIPGATVIVAATAEEALRLVVDHVPDVCLVDFDLPDADGPSLIAELRKVYQGPIFMTAYPDENVEALVEHELFAYDDASSWLRKPLKFDELSQRIDLFLLQGKRTRRRFQMKARSVMKQKSPGRGKRALSVPVKVINLSLGGVCVELAKDQVWPSNDWTIDLKSILPRGAKSTVIDVTCCWVSDGKAGLGFHELSRIQAEGIEKYLRKHVSEPSMMVTKKAS